MDEKSITHRNNYIDFLKGIGIFLVVYAHCNLHQEETMWLIYRFHMPLFFLISGYLFSAGDKFPKFFVKKFKTLIIPYFIFFIYSFLISKFVLLKDFMVKDVLCAFFLGAENLTTVANWALWYIQFFFIAALVFYFIVKLNLINPVTILILFAVSPFWSNLFFNKFEYKTPFSLQVLLAALFFMAVGYYCKRHKWWILSFKSKWVNAVISISAIILGYLISVGNNEQIISVSNHIYLISAILIVFGLVNLTLGISNRYIEYLGRKSLIILGLHRPFMNVLLYTFGLKAVLQKNNLGGDVGALFISLIDVCVIVFVCLIIDFIKKTVHKRKAESV